MIRRRPMRISKAVVLGFILFACLSPQSRAQSPVEPTADSPRAKGWKKTTLIKNLEHPWSLAFLPGGDMLITERPGRLRLVRDGKLVEAPVEGVPPVLSLNQGGLMEVSLHPDFADNKFVYLTYAAGTSESNRTVLARGVLDGSALRDVKTLLQVKPSKTGGEHFGSNLAWLADGTLLMSVGDGGNPPRKIDGALSREQAQRFDSLLGKVLRLKADGSAPEDNPFVGRENARPEIYTYGNRNIQGLAVDPASGRVWASEHGPLGGDELNLIRRGENYGWPKTSYGRDYKTGEPISPKRTLPGMVDPRIVWTPSPASSGLVVYTGDRFPDWKGDLFSGELVSEQVRRIDLDGEKVKSQESIPIGSRVRAVDQGPDGLLYVLTDEDNGKLIRIEPE